MYINKCTNKQTKKEANKNTHNHIIFNCFPFFSSEPGKRPTGDDTYLRELHCANTKRWFCNILWIGETCLCQTQLQKMHILLPLILLMTPRTNLGCSQLWTNPLLLRLLVSTPLLKRQRLPQVRISFSSLYSHLLVSSQHCVHFMFAGYWKNLPHTRRPVPYTDSQVTLIVTIMFLWIISDVHIFISMLDIELVCCSMPIMFFNFIPVL